ncbi:aurora kinase A and ninein-interacting protein isoform X2 [Choloepus didactylus]|uniref:aurora kinase A and ninein-interacting protein isoform X2 n=1 Tax=Choloepus didactylus TaxID=27675 RepID=UPI00189F070D|nr:aurora kinase A and ninein-interacting protein isoform X2 [Choloepus didactylus]
MRRRSPEEEACGVWLDAAALKKRKVQTHLIKPGTKMLTLFPGESKAKVSFTQRRTPPSCIRQTSIASYFTLQPGKTNGGDQKSVSSHIASETNKETKKEATQLDHFLQGLGDDCVAPPLATSTPADIQESGLSPQFLQEASGHHRVGTPVSTVLSLLQPETLISAGESKASQAFSFPRNFKTSCLLDQKERGDSSGEREWIHGSKKKNYQDMERYMKPPGGKCQQPLDTTKLERKVSAKEHRQASMLLQTYRSSWNGENTESVKQSPCSCPVTVFSWDSERSDKNSWSQLFTEDTQGQRVIAHSSRVPFQDLTNNRKQGLGPFLASPQAQCQDGPTQLNLQPDLLFTQDSEGNQVIRHHL